MLQFCNGNFEVDKPHVLLWFLFLRKILIKVRVQVLDFKKFIKLRIKYKEALVKVMDLA